MSDKELYDEIKSAGNITPEMEKAYNARAPFWMFVNDEEYE